MKRWPWWVFAGILLPFGLGGIAAMVPGVQRRKPLWIACGVLALAMVGVSELIPEQADGDNSTAGLFLILGWVISISTVLAVRKPFLALEAAGPSDWERGKAGAQARLQQRREALELVGSDPELARELGVGRPDVRGAQHAGLVDVNHAGPAAIEQLPGFDRALAERVVAIREDVNGFATLADFGAVTDLDGNHVERLRGRAVFLPR